MHKIIAEIGSVHNGNLKIAKKIVKAAKFAGADIVKFQMHISEEETTKDAPSPNYFKKENRFDYFKRINFSYKDWLELKRFCTKNNIEFLCSPFSEKAVEILEKIGVKKYKIPSGEVTNIPMLEKIKKTNKLVFLSTGMSNYNEINDALKKLNKKKTYLLQCTSQYPCKLENIGPNIFSEYKKKFNLPIGFSDHTLGFAASAYAASIGAKVIEKHFTLSKKMYGSDAKHSMEPKEFKLFTKIIKEIWFLQKYKINKNKLKSMKEMKYIFEKSIVFKRDLPKGKSITREDLAFKKPSKGIKPILYVRFIGKKLKRSVRKDDFLKYKHFND